MKKIVIGVSALMLVALLLPFMALMLLQTQYGTTVFNQLAKQAHWPVQAQTVHYTFPYQLTFSDVQLFEQDPLYIAEIRLWFNPSVYRDNQWQLDSLLLDGIKLTNGLPNALRRVPREHVHLHQLALKNVDVAYQDHAVRGLDLQVQQPVWLNAQQWLPFGELQLAAEQWYWQGEAVDNLLLDMTYRPQNSTIFGASFDWRGAHLSGQAEQYPTGWSLVNVTIDGLKLNTTLWDELKNKPWQGALNYVNHINSLDLLRSDVHWGPWHWVNLNLSLENVSLPMHPFAQNQATVSFSAESVQDAQHMWVEPRANLSLNGADITVHEIATNWQQGLITASGVVRPDKLHIDTLAINRLKWVIESDADLEWIARLISYAPTWQVDNLDIKRSQIIQLAQKPYWQVTGLSASGQQMTVKHDGLWGLWQGAVELSAANASYHEVLASQPIITMQSEQGNWHLTRLNVPLEQGFIHATGAIELAKISRPWWLEFEAEGVPSEKWLALPPLLKLQGLSSWEGRLFGLGGDESMLNHTLSGEVNGQMHDTQASLDDQTWQEVTISPITLDMDRGRVSLANVTMSGGPLSGTVMGQFDLAQRGLNTLRYEIKQGCAQWRGLWLDDRSQSYNACQIGAHTPIIQSHSSRKMAQATSLEE